MESNRLKQSPVNQLVGVKLDPQTEQAAKSSTKNISLSISEVWSEWAVGFTQVEREILAFGENLVRYMK